MHPTLTSCPAQMQLHLQLLFIPAALHYPEGLIQIQALCPTKEKSPRSEYFDLNNKNEAVAYAQQLNQQGYNVYVGPNPRKPNTKGNATNNDIEIAFFHYGDFDNEDSVKRFYQATDKPMPHFRVITGNTPTERFHTYYQLTTPCRNMEQWENTQRGLIEFYKSDPNIADPRRIMRLAGTVSYPSQDKMQRGYIPTLVRIYDVASVH